MKDAEGEVEGQATLLWELMQGLIEQSRRFRRRDSSAETETRSQAEELLLEASGLNLCLL